MHIEKGLSLGYFQDIFLNIILSCTLCEVISYQLVIDGHVAVDILDG